MKTLISCFILSFLPSTVMAQNCLKLTGTAACGPFADSEVLITSNGPFTDVTTFDNFMKARSDNETSYINDFRQRYACPNYQGQGQRYHLSVLCGLFVDTATSNGCNKASPGIQACKTTIESAENSLTALFSGSQNICNQATLPARDDLLRTYRVYLQRANQKTPKCVLGLPNEVANCGYFTTNEANEYCRNIKDDPCCQQLGQTSPTILEIINGANSTAVPHPSQKEAQASGTPTGVIAGAGIAGFLGLMIIIFLLVVCIRRRSGIKAAGVSAAGASSAALYSNKNDPDGVEISETYQVIYNYVPNLSDEIQLYVGDPVMVKVKFDDGWALGYNLSTKQEGSFPLACVAPYSSNNIDDPTKSRDSAAYGQRASSLYLPK